MRLRERDWVVEYLVWPTIGSGFLVGAAAVLRYPWVGEVSVADSDASLALSALIAAGLVGWVAWVVVSAFGTEYEPADGAFAGAVTGGFAHPVMWFLWPLLSPSSVSAGESVFMAAIMPFASVYGLIFLGRVTMPHGSIGGVAGGLVQRSVRRLGAGARADDAGSGPTDPEAEREE